MKDSLRQRLLWIIDDYTNKKEDLEEKLKLYQKNNDYLSCIKTEIVITELRRFIRDIKAEVE
jgi:hypothetical protein